MTASRAWSAIVLLKPLNVNMEAALTATENFSTFVEETKIAICDNLDLVATTILNKSNRSGTSTSAKVKISNSSYLVEFAGTLALKRKLKKLKLYSLTIGRIAIESGG